MSVQKVAVVTGSNKGIGYEIVRGLCKKFDGIVYLTSIDEKLGKAAVSLLEKENLKPRYHQLDITQPKSIEKFRDFIKKEHGGLDLLINNAAIMYTVDSDTPMGVQAKETVGVNYFSTLRLCDAMFPLLRNNARVVNITSSAGHITSIPSQIHRKALSRPDLTVPELSKLMEKFVQDVQNGKMQEEGWGKNNYAISKAGISSLTIIQQRMFDQETPFRNISVNSVHPGWVRTDMSNNKGNRSSEEGAEAPLWVALEANLKGKYVWDDCRLVDWAGETRPPKPIF